MEYNKMTEEDLWANLTYFLSASFLSLRNVT